MDNLLKLKAAFSAAAVVFAASANAQPAANAQLLAPTPIEKASAADIEGFLAPLGATVTPFEDADDTNYTVIATVESGAQFLVTLFGCADPATGSNCEGVSSYAGFSNAGLSYDDLNRYNIEAAGSKAINIADQNAVIFGVQQFFAGGVSRENVQFVIVLFLADLDKFMASRANGQTSVSMTLGGDDPVSSKTGNVLSPRPAPASFGPYSIKGAISSAINNTGDARFRAPSQP